MSLRSLGIPARSVIILMAVETGVAVFLAVARPTDLQIQRQTGDANRHLVRELLLTDLALSSGTSYTRHPSQADLFAPHNEHPAAIEHFPAGSIVQPPVPRPATSPVIDEGAGQ